MFSHACERYHQSGVVCLCAFETVGCYWYLISYGREGINNIHLQTVKKVYKVLMLLLKALLVVGLTISRF